MQLDYLRSAGADLAQGFLLGRPQPAEAITALLEAGPLPLEASHPVA